MFGVEVGPLRATAVDSDTSRESRDLAQFFLERLRRLADLRAGAVVDSSPAGKRLVDFALYSVYWDCLALDQREEARQILGLLDSKAA